jgi:hypothetical protein
MPCHLYCWPTGLRTPIPGMKFRLPGNSKFWTLGFGMARQRRHAKHYDIAITWLPGWPIPMPAPVL